MVPVLDFFFFNSWLYWAFLAVQGLFSNCSDRGLLSGCSGRASHSGGFSCCGTEALGATASVVVVFGFSCPIACGILLDQGSNPWPLHRRQTLINFLKNIYLFHLFCCARS